MNCVENKKRELDTGKVKSIVWRLYRPIEKKELSLIESFIEDSGFVRYNNPNEEWINYRHAHNKKFHLKVLQFSNSVKFNAHIDVGVHKGCFYDSNTDRIMRDLIDTLKAQYHKGYSNAVILVNSQRETGFPKEVEVIKKPSPLKERRANYQTRAIESNLMNNSFDIEREIDDYVRLIEHQKIVKEGLDFRINRLICRFERYLLKKNKNTGEEQIKNVLENLLSIVNVKKSDVYQKIELSNDFIEVETNKNSFVNWLKDQITLQKKLLKDPLPIVFNGVLLGTPVIVNLLIAVKNRTCDKNRFLTEIKSYYSKNDKELRFSEECIKELLFNCVKIARKCFNFFDFCLLVGMFARWSSLFRENFQKERMFINMILERGAGENFPIKNSQDLLNSLITFNDASNLGIISVRDILKVAYHEYKKSNFKYLNFEKVFNVINEIITKGKRNLKKKVLDSLND